MASATQKAPDTGMLTIPPIEIKTYILRIVGDSPLITHAWSEKAKKQMRDKQMGKAQARKEAKNPEQEYQDAFYRMEDGTPAVRAISFKSAAVDAATQLNGLTKVFLRGAFHVDGELVPVEGVPHMREDMVRVGMGTADLRYRPQFDEWAVNLRVRVNARAITLEQLVHLFNQAGFSSGIGEWRPQKDGASGMFHVEGVQEVRR
jgi:hypothetical protein